MLLGTTLLFSSIALGQASGEAARPSPEPPRVSLFVPPRIVHRVDAAYPDEARRLGLTASVLLQLVVETDGTVRDVHVAKGAGHGFDESAMAAARELRFEPATQGGTPVVVQVNYEVSFVLTPVATLHDTATSSAPAPPASTPAPAGPVYESTVSGERPYTAASAITVRNQDFHTRAILTPEDILQLVPGLVTAQHQGGGKADQIFLRGFDADHGTDVALYLDGIPINMPSHAHGQGYSDLHFLIPEVIDHMDVQKGPYSAEHGDFDTAGSANLVTKTVIEKSEVSVEGGTFLKYCPACTGRVLGIAAQNWSNLHVWFAGELYHTDGPFQTPENWNRYNMMSKLTWDIAPRVQVSLLGTAYGSSWTGSGQIPARLVQEGFLTDYGSVDPTEGGDTSRQQLILSFTARPDEVSRLSISFSAINYGLTLFNDFTFQLRDPVNGDEIEQDDQRVTLAGTMKYERTTRGVLPGVIISTFGSDIRNDQINASLWHVHQRARHAECFDAANPCVNTTDRQTDAALFVQEDWRINRYVRVIGGLRADLFEFDVHSNLPGGVIESDQTQPVPPSVEAGIVSPKFSAVVTPVPAQDIYLNFGSGFHSNDARSVIESNGVGALPRALGGEVGSRTRLLGERLQFAAALWILHLDSEQVWNGDTGGTEPAGPTLRYGVDIEGRYTILPWLFADIDATFSHGQYTGVDAANGNAIALAPPWVITGGLTARHPIGIEASIRLRSIGDRPGDNYTPQSGVPQCTPQMDASTAAGPACYLVARGYTVLDATLGYSTPHWTVQAVINNLTNTAYREAQFGDIAQVISPPGGHTVSTKGAVWTPETHPVQDIYFTPGNPIGLLLNAAYRF